jgi:uncharacterized protein (UPF0297 family)
MNDLTLMTQVLLKASGAVIKIDGIMGPKTRKAIARLPVVERQIPALKKMLADVTPLRPDVDWVPVSKVTEYCTEASLVTGISAKTLLWMVDLEATKTGTRSGLMYNAKSVSKADSVRNQHKGLGQLNSVAWNEAMAYGSRYHRGVVIGSFDENWMNPRRSILAMAYYSKLTEQYAKPLMKNLAMTEPVRYTLYNQGAGFITKVLRGDPTVLGDQSDAAGRLRNIARAQILAA